MTLTSDLVSSIYKCLGHISYIICGRNPKFGVCSHLEMAECRVQFLGHCDLGPDL